MNILITINVILLLFAIAVAILYVRNLPPIPTHVRDDWKRIRYGRKSGRRCGR